METMKRSLWLLVMVIFAVSLVSLSACSRRAAKKDRGGETLEEEAMKPMGEQGISEQELAEARRKVAELRQKEGALLATVYFEFDDFSLSPQAKARGPARPRRAVPDLAGREPLGHIVVI